MAETRLSKVLIKQQKLDEQGKPVFDEQGNPVYVYTEVPFAADIDDFIVYTDDEGTAHSVKDLVFGDTPPSDFITKGDMWTQLKTQADACQKTLTDNASFWDGLSKAEYTQPSDPDSATSVNGEYLASGDQINALRFYGEDAGDSMEGEREKLISLGALEDFAKRIPTMGNANGIALGKGSKAEQTNSFAVSGGIAQYPNSVAIGPGTTTWKEGQVILGKYNELDWNADLIIGIGDSAENLKTGLKLIPNNAYHTSSLRPTLYTDAFNAHGEWVSTCDQRSGVLTQSTGMNSVTIEQPLELWTKAMVCLNGVDATDSILASQSIIIMPKDMLSPGSGVIWHSQRIDSGSASASTINVTSVRYDNLNKKITINLSVSVGQMTQIYYACEFTGMAM